MAEVALIVGTATGVAIIGFFGGARGKDGV